MSENLFETINVSIIGKTNAGKSTLLNAIIGEKVSIVTPKKQTTRENILGILNEENCQIVFVDTPGIHKTTNDLGKSMMKSVRSAMQDVDINIYVVDANKPFDKQEFDNIAKQSENLKIILVLSKIDLAGYEKTYFLIDKFQKIKQLVAILPLSAKKDKNIDVLVEEIKKFTIKVNKNDLQFEQDIYTDKSVKFLSQEIIREKSLLLLDKEIPHGIFVEIINFKELKNIVKIDADIICQKDSHKAIIIGKHGNKLKQIAMDSRQDIEKLLNMKVMLTLFVKSREK